MIKYFLYLALASLSFGYPGSIPNAQPMMQETLRLKFSCKNLKKMDFASNSDPQLELFTFSPIERQWKSLDKTEMIKDNPDPSFQKSIQMNFNLADNQKLKFQLWDVDKYKNDDLGSHEVFMNELISQYRSKGDYSFRVKDSGVCHVFLSRSNTNQDAKYFLYLEGIDLSAKDSNGLSDPYVLIKQIRQDTKDTSRWPLIAKTEIILKNRNPKWKPLLVPMSAVYENNLHGKLFVQVFDFDRDSQHDLIGEFEISMAEIMNTERKVTMKKHGLAKLRWDKNQLSIKAIEAPRFLDYIQSGLEIEVVAALDFTGSSAGLHQQPESQNEYMRSLMATAQVLLPFDSDKKIPLYKFGDLENPSRDPAVCSYLRSDRPEAGSLPEAAEIYRKCVASRPRMSGPTQFHQTIKQFMSGFNDERQASQSNKYRIAILITDGGAHDMEQTKKALIKASRYPLSVMIIGVGGDNEEFKKMEELDGDGSLLAVHGEQAARDIVQFVKFRDYSQLEAFSTALLAELPQQMVEYYMSKGIRPRTQFPVYQSSGYPSSHSSGYPQPPAGYPTGHHYPSGQSNYPAGYPSGHSSGYSQPPAGYPSSHSTGYPQPPAGYPTMSQSNYPAGQSSGFPSLGQSNNYPQQYPGSQPQPPPGYPQPYQSQHQPQHHSMAFSALQSDQQPSAPPMPSGFGYPPQYPQQQQTSHQPGYYPDIGRLHL